MPLRIGPGPVFVYEWLTTTRRWQLYAMRAGFVLTILVGLTFVWSQISSEQHALGHRVTLDELAQYGEAIFFTIAVIELSLVLLAAPAATAGAICLDKARGTLDHMLATDLSNAEIVLGKLGARLISILNLIASLVPVIAITSLLGGIEPESILGLFLVSIGCAFVGCSLAMMLSVWGRKTHEVVMLTYVIIVLWLLFPVITLMMLSLFVPRPSGAATLWLWELLINSNPFYVALGPSIQPSKVDLVVQLIFLVACVTAGSLMTAVATFRVRQVALRQSGRPATSGPDRSKRRNSARRRLPGLPGPSLDGNPVAWREWHRMRPSWMLRIAWMFHALMGVLWLLYSFSRPIAVIEEMAMFTAVQVAVGLLLVSVGAATSLAEERVRGSLDILLSTPMSTISILAGKWWGSYRRLLPVVFWPAVFGARIMRPEPRDVFQYLILLSLVFSYGAVITSLGLAAATWIRRPGKAVALCVAAYVGFSIGWPVLLFLIVSGQDEGLASLLVPSPPIGTFLATAMVNEHGIASATQLLAITLPFSTLLNFLIAMFLFALTARSFDGRMGRMPDDPTVACRIRHSAAIAASQRADRTSPPTTPKE